MSERFESQPGDPSNLAVEIDAQIARGLYSNVVLVSRSTTELTLDFAYAQPHARVVVQARIILAPANARELIHRRKQLDGHHALSVRIGRAVWPRSTAADLVLAGQVAPERATTCCGYSR
mgnify:CR=1 FL=1